jgi:hypothetical protein
VAKSYDVAFKFADEQITNQHILTKITNYIRDHDFSLRYHGLCEILAQVIANAKLKARANCRTLLVLVARNA